MTLRSFPWVLVAALAGGGAFSYVQLSDKWTAELTKLERELSALKRDQGNGPAVIREVHVSTHENTGPSTPTLSAAASAPPEPEDLAALEAKRQKYAHARASLLEREHANEPEDAEWARAAEAKLDELYSALEFQALRITASCKYTLCRLDIAYVDPQEGPQAFQKFMQTPPWSGRRFTHLDLERGEGSAYLVREGFSLPTVDPKSIEN